MSLYRPYPSYVCNNLWCSSLARSSAFSYFSPIAISFCYRAKICDSRVFTYFSRSFKVISTLVRSLSHYTFSLSLSSFTLINYSSVKLSFDLSLFALACKVSTFYWSCLSISVVDWFKISVRLTST